MAPFSTIPKLGLGCVNLGGQGKGGDRLVRVALDLGIEFFDTADAYGSGSSEKVLGRSLRGRRRDVSIASKVGYVFQERSMLSSYARVVAGPALRSLRRHGRASLPGLAGGTAYHRQDFSPAYVRVAVEGSLRRMGTDYVDLMQLHGPRSLELPAVEVLADLQAEGKIRKVGVGVEAVGAALPWLDVEAIQSVQLPFGILDPEARYEVIPRARERALLTVVRGVFAAGLVARPREMMVDASRPEACRLNRLIRLGRGYGVEPLQLAAWFVRAQPGISIVLIGTTSADHLRQSVEALRKPCPAGLLEDLNELAASRCEPA